MYSISNKLVLRPRDICELLSMPRSTLYLKIANGDFPKPFKLSKNSTKRSAVGWKRSTIDQWLDECANSANEEIGREQ